MNQPDLSQEKDEVEKLRAEVLDLKAAFAREVASVNYFVRWDEHRLASIYVDLLPVYERVQPEDAKAMEAMEEIVLRYGQDPGAKDSN